MATIGILTGILFAIAIGAMSPGPSFVLVSRVSISHSRLHGLASAIGMGLGGALFATLALVGLVTLLQQVEWLYLLLKFGGGLYLVYLATRIWQGAKTPLVAAGSGEAAGTGASVWHSLGLAFATQISNPKTAVVYASIFAALMPAAPPLAMLLVLPPAIFAVETSWYAVVAIAFSAPRAQKVYLRWKIGIDRLAALVIGGLGLRLVGETVSSAARLTLR
ncbi:LysE family translocator [Rhizobium glycinendophyticum]|uniref:LysE family translocator n=1 Tax=Rhizobium glycinendophyticum TaxID=2589807 RepID=A0A504U8T6_9HYPH|nr:LysE family transporter [Rhizobium glycinendophyticum]TPP09887.1 LysE family translocator [Rhizobium glycinendophyticum]